MVVGNPKLSPQLIERCKALGAEQMTLLVRDAEIPEIDSADVEIVVDKGVSRLYGESEQLKSVELTDLSEGGTEIVEVDHLIFASGRIPELIFLPVEEPATEEDGEGEPRMIPGAWQALPPYKQPAFHHETGLMAKGDNLTDFQAAIKAIAAGRRAAASIHYCLYDLPLDQTDNVVTPETLVQNVDHVSRVRTKPRQIMPLAGPSQTAFGGELEKGFSAEAAKLEADRCLQCGLICYRRDPEQETSQNDVQAYG
jgi:hypothetical protein